MHNGGIPQLPLQSAIDVIIKTINQNYVTFNDVEVNTIEDHEDLL